MSEIHNERPTLILLHAFPFSGAMWEPQRRALADRVRMLTPDFPGFGGAPGLDEDSLTMERMAQIVEGMLDTHGIERCILGGLSMGGYVAFECWRRFSGRISGLILADTKAGPDDEKTRAGRYAAAERIGKGEYEAYAEELIGKLLWEGTRRERPEVVDAVRSMILATHPESATPALLGMASRADSTDLLATIDVPTALIFGEHDGITNLEEARKMEAAIPGATLTSIPEAGHLSSVERPEAFNRAVEALIGSVVVETAA